MSEKYIAMRIIIILGIIVLSVGCLYAQHSPGPYTYEPPKGVNRWSDTPGTKHSYRPISMNELSPLDNTEDGLVVAFNFDADLELDKKPIVAFSTQGEKGENILEFVYSQRTVIVRRYSQINGVRKYYDYHLFDPIFEDIGQGVSTTWKIRIYFTSGFVYIVCRNGLQTEIRNLMSPLYFGLDSKNRYPDPSSNMYKFINRDSSAFVKVGDPTSSLPPYIHNIEINSVVYNDWWFTVQKEFSSPNPPTSTDGQPAGYQDYSGDLY